jgi:hypothetical protein
MTVENAGPITIPALDHVGGCSPVRAWATRVETHTGCTHTLHALWTTPHGDKFVSLTGDPDQFSGTALWLAMQRQLAIHLNGVR